jgi:hypothetical protein
MNKKTFYSVAFLLLAILVFHWRVLFTNQFGFPWDILSYYYPSLHFIHEQVRQGSFPLWDPYLFSGFPIIGDPQAGTVYPLNYLLFLFQIGAPLKYKAVECLLVFHYFLAGLFMYIFARSFRISEFSALISGLVYMLSGYMASHAQHMATTHSMVWIPLIFYFARLSFLKKSLWYVILTGLALAMQSLIGYVQMACYTLLALLLFYLWEMSLSVAETKRLYAVRRLLGYLVLMLTVFAGITAILMIPTYELGSLSIRKLVEFDEAVSGMSPIHLISLLLPNFLGGLRGKPAMYGRDVTETDLYIGILPLILVFLSFRYFKHLQKRDYFWVICSVLFTLLCFGGETFLAEAIYYLVPGFNYLHRLVNYFSIANVCLCLLAGFGMQALTSNDPLDAEQKPIAFNRLMEVPILLAVVILIAGFLLISAPDNLHVTIGKSIVELTLLLVFFLASAGLLALHTHKLLPAPIGKTLMLVVLLVDVFGYNHNQPFNAGRFNPNTELTPRLLGGSPSLLNFLRRDNPDNWRMAFTCGQQNGPNVFKMRSINGYNPIMLKSYSEFLPQFFPSQWLGAAFDFNSPLVDLLGVKYVITCDTFHEQTKLGDLPAQKYDLVFREWFRVYKNKSELSPVGFFPQAVTLEDDGAILSLLSDASFFDPRRVLVLKKAAGRPVPDQLTATPVFLKIEAEHPDRKSTGTVEKTKSASDGKFLGYWGKVAGDFAEYSFHLPKDLERCTLAVRYCSAEGMPTNWKISIINDASTTSEPLTLPPTVHWNSEWHLASVTLKQLKKGRNTLRIESTSPVYVNTDNFFLIEQIPTTVASSRARLQMVDYKPTAITIEAATDREGFLFLNEIDYPGWKAYVDGQEEAVLKANYLFRAIRLKAGSHRVVFKFQPTSFYLGATITLLTLVALTVYFFGGWIFFKVKEEQEKGSQKESRHAQVT